jgi:pimeloyl-ACP methyl ester carboxylesterase
MPADEVEEGVLSGGAPYRVLGSGPPLVYLPPFAPYHRLPTGLSRTIEVKLQRGFAAPGFRVCQVNRPEGLQPGTTMRDLAGHAARALEELFPGPVDVLGFSTGGVVALNLAAYFPQRVSRLVLASAAHVLSPVAHAACEAAAERAQARDVRGFQASMAPTATNSRVGQVVAAGFGWLIGPLFLNADWDPADAIATLRADLTVDVEKDLGAVAAQTLILCGDRDPSYPVETTAALEQRLPRARRIVYPRTGHGVVMERRFASDLAAFLRG